MRVETKILTWKRSVFYVGQNLELIIVEFIKNKNKEDKAIEFIKREWKRQCSVKSTWNQSV